MSAKRVDEGIVDSGLSPEAEEVLFPPQKKEGGEVVEEKVQSVSETPNMEITSPAHLWNLGAVKLHFVVRNMQEAAAMVGQCQELFRNLEKGYADRIEEVEELKNRVTLPQLEMLEDLAEQRGEELPDDYETMSKTQASKLISEWMQPAGGGQSQERSSRRSRRSSGARTTRRTRRTSSFRSSRRSSNSDDGITSAQMRYIRRLCRDLGEDVPDDLASMTKQEASDLIQELESELEG